MTECGMRQAHAERLVCCDCPDSVTVTGVLPLAGQCVPAHGVAERARDTRCCTAGPLCPHCVCEVLRARELHGRG